MSIAIVWQASTLAPRDAGALRRDLLSLWFIRRYLVEHDVRHQVRLVEMEIAEARAELVAVGR